MQTRIVCGDDAGGNLHATGQVWKEGRWQDLCYWHGEVLIMGQTREVQNVIRVYSIEEYSSKRRRWRGDLGN
jgi:hypothetical protein